MLTPDRIGICGVIDNNDPSDGQFFWIALRNIRIIPKLPDEIQWYGRAPYTQDALKGRTEFTLIEKVTNQIPVMQAHAPDTYAPTFGHVIFIIGFHVPLTISEDGQWMTINFVSHRSDNLQTSGLEYLSEMDSIEE
jgi:hypothetical protein